MQITNPQLPPDREATAHATPSPQLVKAANAFEANFLGELLKPLREDPLFGNGSGLGGDSLGEDNAGGSMGTVSSLASDALAQAIAKRGGFGIAKMVLSELAPVEKTASQALAPALDPKCGDCARSLTIGTDAAGSLSSAAIEMLGEGNVSAPQASSIGNASAEKTRRGAVFSKSGEGAQRRRPIRSVAPGP
jgi:Rod binding domain-containing protein